MSGLPETGHDLQPADGRAENATAAGRSWVLPPHERHRRGMRPELSRTVPLLPQCRWSGQRHPHRIEAELISALAMGTNLDVAAADQSRPSATRAAKLINPMRRIFIPHLGKMGLAYFSPSECEVAHTSRGINGGHQTPTGPRRPAGA